MDKIDVVSLYKIKDKIKIIDVRSSGEFASGHIPGAKNLTMNALILNNEQFLDRNEIYYLTCQSGTRSSLTCKALREKGYNVIDIEGGTSAYHEHFELER